MPSSRDSAGRLSTPHQPFVTSTLDDRKVQDRLEEVFGLVRAKTGFFFSHSYNDHVDMASSDSNTNVHDEHAADAANHSDPALEIDVRLRPACLAISV